MENKIFGWEESWSEPEEPLDFPRGRTDKTFQMRHLGQALRLT
jgi:hypothetical protein